jgi:hypothetical protein
MGDGEIIPVWLGRRTLTIREKCSSAPKLRKAQATSQARPARLGAARLIFKGYEGQAADQD